MSRPHFHRWAAIFLLVSNLILGQFAHAMPHMGAATTHEVVALAGQDSPECGDHVQAGSSDQSQDSSTDSPADNDCCERGGCACPCLHSPAAVAGIPFTVQCASADRVAGPVEGAAWHRLSTLFRPPA